MNAHFDDLVEAWDIAKGTNLSSLEIAIEEKYGHHNDLCKSLAISTDATTPQRTSDAC